MKRLKLWFSKRFYRIAIAWWWAWSQVYRFLFHRKYKHIVLPQDLSAAGAQRLMDNIKWTADGAKELGDSCGDPRWVQYVLNEIGQEKNQPKGALDCDDFAAWACNVVRADLEPRILSVSWIRDGKLGGHAVCVCMPPGLKLFHIGNWGKIGWFDSLRITVDSIRRRAGAELLVGWHLRDKNMKMVDWGTDLPGY